MIYSYETKSPVPLFSNQSNSCQVIPIRAKYNITIDTDVKERLWQFSSCNPQQYLSSWVYSNMRSKIMSKGIVEEYCFIKLLL